MREVLSSPALQCGEHTSSTEGSWVQLDGKVLIGVTAHPTEHPALDEAGRREGGGRGWGVRGMGRVRED